jgi:hypothetical protein
MNGHAIGAYLWFLGSLFWFAVGGSTGLGVGILYLVIAIVFFILSFTVKLRDDQPTDSEQTDPQISEEDINEAS